MALAEPLVHAVEVGRKQGGLVAAGTGPDLHDGVAVVVWIAGEQQLVQLLGQSGDFLREVGPRSALARATSSGSDSRGQLPRLVQLS